MNHRKGDPIISQSRPHHKTVVTPLLTTRSREAPVLRAPVGEKNGGAFFGGFQEFGQVIKIKHFYLQEKGKRKKRQGKRRKGKEKKGGGKDEEEKKRGGKK